VKALAQLLPNPSDAVDLEMQQFLHLLWAFRCTLPLLEHVVHSRNTRLRFRSHVGNIYNYIFIYNKYIYIAHLLHTFVVDYSNLIYIYRYVKCSTRDASEHVALAPGHKHVLLTFCGSVLPEDPQHENESIAGN
jgi:hypothetical protein